MEVETIVLSKKLRVYLSDSNGIWAHNHLVCKRTLNHLAKLVIQANYKVYIHSETRTWHDNNIQSNAPYR